MDLIPYAFTTNEDVEMVDETSIEPTLPSEHVLHLEEPMFGVEFTEVLYCTCL